MSLRSRLSIVSIFGDVVDTSLPVDDPSPNTLDVGVLATVVEAAGPKSKLDGVVGHSMPMGVAGLVLFSTDAEVLELTEGSEEGVRGIVVGVEVEGILGVCQKETSALEASWH